MVLQKCLCLFLLPIICKSNLTLRQPIIHDDCYWSSFAITGHINLGSESATPSDSADQRVETGADHLRHTKFVAIRGDREPRKVVRET
jgi:hypothetical protein